MVRSQLGYGYEVVWTKIYIGGVLKSYSLSSIKVLNAHKKVT